MYKPPISNLEKTVADWTERVRAHLAQHHITETTVAHDPTHPYGPILIRASGVIGDVLLYEALLQEHAERRPLALGRSYYADVENVFDPYSRPGTVFQGWHLTTKLWNDGIHLMFTDHLAG